MLQECQLDVVQVVLLRLHLARMANMMLEGANNLLPVVLRNDIEEATNDGARVTVV